MGGSFSSTYNHVLMSRGVPEPIDSRRRRTNVKPTGLRSVYLVSGRM